ncbi:MAG: hypothetical protein ACREYF_03410 [Gammaproteobacteria bacterium]
MGCPANNVRAWFGPYQALQLEDLAADAMRVLERNYPSHPGVVDVKKLVVK